jgi:hypothetical protein
MSKSTVKEQAPTITRASLAISDLGTRAGVLVLEQFHTLSPIHAEVSFKLAAIQDMALTRLSGFIVAGVCVTAKQVFDEVGEILAVEAGTVLPETSSASTE